ncbi:MAG: putative colanic acid biosynthesis acetyltransferase [Proteobacteria bacterium]|nr:putative colanic acid biosynthesis acetyltransferase [Pseudomonadota bacterium]
MKPTHIPMQKSPFDLITNLRRTFWILIGKPLFRISFHNWYFYRNIILNVFGAKIASTARLRRSVQIEMPWNLEMAEFSTVGSYAYLYNLAPIYIGHEALISQYAQICTGTHNYEDPKMPLVSKAIRIERRCWIATGAFIGPGVYVAEGAILGAKSVTFKNLEKWTIYAGNPAKIIKTRKQF